MTIQQRIAVFTAALIYAGISISIIAMPVTETEIPAIATGFGSTHI